MKAKVVSKEEWLQARVMLLAKEKELTRRHDDLSLQPTCAGRF